MSQLSWNKALWQARREHQLDEQQKNNVQAFITDRTAELLAEAAAEVAQDELAQALLPQAREAIAVEHLRDDLFNTSLHGILMEAADSLAVGTAPGGMGKPVEVDLGDPNLNLAWISIQMALLGSEEPHEATDGLYAILLALRDEFRLGEEE